MEIKLFSSIFTLMIRLCIAFFLFPILCFGQKQSVLMHSHNDYLQKMPLSTALAFQANSIEVDIALYKKKIKVCHFPFFLNSKPDFEALYLKPLLENKTKLSSVQFLFVDIKSGGTEILEELNLLVSKYSEIFAERNENSSHKIKIIVSGATDRSVLVKNTALNFLFVDGRKENLSQKIDSSIMPVVSANFKRLSAEEQKELILLAHQENKKVRFWNTADTKDSWQKLIQLGVDIIGVDEIEKFSLFLCKI